MLVPDLQPAQTAALNRFGFSLINWRVVAYVDTFKIKGVNGAGKIEYDNTTIENTSIDLTPFILNQDIILNATIPVLPTTDGKDTKASNIDIQVSNIQAVLASVQQGAVIDINNLYKSKVEIYVNLGAGITEMYYYGGNIYAIAESNGSTILSIRDYSFTKFQNAWLFAVTGGLYYINTSGVVVNTPVVFAPSMAYPYMNYKIYAGICNFDEFGNVGTSIEGVDSLVYEIREIYFLYPPITAIAPLLGQYSVEFTTDTKFIVTTPNGIKYNGNIAVTFSEGSIYIPTTAWVIIDTTPGKMKGQKFTFYDSFCVSGNPISIVRDLIYRASTNDWVNTPTYTFTGVDWAAFDYYEMLFRNVVVYITEFNSNNDVFLPLSPSEKNRLTCKQIIAKIMSHIGCQITFDNQGRISMNVTWYSLGGQSIWQLGSIHCGESQEQRASHSLTQTKPIRFLRVLFGFNKLKSSSNFAETVLKGEIIVDDQDEQEVFEVGFEYYKYGISRNLIKTKIGELLWRSLSLQHIRLNAKVLPNFGVSLQVGDKFIADFNVAPVLPNTEKGIGQYWQIYNISKGKRGATIDAVCIPTPIRVDLLCNTFIWCVSQWI